jgi:two-component system, OmpR family, KDP operon response regulator KdpE
MNIDQSDPFYKAQILVVDDERSILLGLKRQLTARGYEVQTATGGIAALRLIEENPPDLIVLDLMMPDLDGLQVTREIRTRLHSDVPILVLSARGEERQKVEALDLGADDYLTKPFGLDELLARIRVALRHSQRLKDEAVQVQPTPTELGNEQLLIDLAKHQVLREGKEIKLTPKQFELLKYLALHSGKLISHRLLLQSVWGSEYGNESQYIHVFIGQLRQKIEPDPARPRYILTEPGLGYRFLLPEEVTDKDS